MNVRMTAMAGVAAILLAAGAGMAAVEIATVPVGNVGNTADTRYETPGYGAVNYEYNIGKYEVTNGQYAEFLNSVAADDPHSLYNTEMGSGLGGITQAGSSGSYTYSVRSGRGNMPVNFVTFWDACRFANWLHNGQGGGETENGAYTLTADGIANNTVTRNADWEWAVTSEDEWYKAAYYNPAASSYYDYPTSSDTVPMAEAPPGGANSANFNWAVGDLTDAGAYASSDSPYGTFDQGGNVREWNEAISIASYRRWRGGSFNIIEFSLHASSWYSYYPTHEVSYVGFRVSEVPEPATMAILMLGGIGVFRRRRCVQR